MDPERRKQLEARRDAARWNPRTQPDPRNEGSILPALRQLGIPHRPATFGIWTPPWLQTSANGVVWESSPVADMTEWAQPPGYWRRPPVPGEEEEIQARRIDQVAGMIDVVAFGDDRLTFGYYAQHTGVEIGANHALPVLNILVPEHEKVWVWGLPNQWLIESDRDGLTRLSLPPEPDPAELANRLRFARAIAAPLYEEIEGGGGEITLWPRENLSNPYLRRPLPMRGWKEKPKSLTAMVQRGDAAGLADEIRDWLEQRAPADTPVFLDLRHPDAPLVEVPADTLMLFFEALARQLSHVEETTDGSVIRTGEIVVHREDHDWHLRLYATGTYWRAEGAD